jgi:chromosome segregation ATPase
MDDTQPITDMQLQLRAYAQEIARLRQELEAKSRELADLRQKLEIRNLSLERLQSQFTVAADAVNTLIKQREGIRTSRWGRLGMWLGFLPKMRDDLE